ncbi:metallophosphoesterase [Bacillus sp. AGMB 02131]|uniref:Metallophosphoesterase n=1 Tax=Peribacillus faecalis TaxID=2772559 RepID=A0A927CTT9_9BACI|nr:metallophosphoesterase [Peribacillus faecalis]MBD3107717.1 metallophosphoesterase [Peribacillus faecalis]
MPIWLSYIVVLTIFNAVVFYIGFTTGKWFFHSKTTFKKIYLIIFILLANVLMFGTMSESVYLRAGSAYWMAFFYVLFLTVPILHILIFFSRYSKIKRIQAEKWAAIITILMVVVVFVYGTYNAYTPIVRSHEVNVKKENTNNLNIVMVADTHFGLLSGKGHAENMVEEINKLKPDLVLIPGDIVDDSINQYVEQGMTEVLAKIDSVYGVYASLGNHDLGDINELIKTLEKSNVNVLYDESVEVADAIMLIGRKDRTDQDRLPLSKLTENIDQTKPVLLLDHQPYELDIAKNEGIDLMVSGHTHRGQLAPFHLFTERIYENDWGYLKKGKLHSIVTSGYGFWGPPIRTSSQSEIVQIQLNY